MKLIIRPTEASDAIFLDQWLQQKDVHIGFPAISNKLERDDSVSRWISMYRYGSSLTAVVDEKPVGIVALILQHNINISHNCEMSICVDEEYRGKGVGTELIKSILKLGKDKFSLESVYLWVSETNRAINLYNKMGFEKIGFHPRWAKVNGQYLGRVLMEKNL